MRFRDYYEVLGVPREADAAALKKAYRKLALEWHPDRHQGAERAQAETRFKELNEAYEVLSDPKKRAKYDRFGKDWESGQEFAPPSGRARTGADFEAAFGDGEGFSDFFRSMFGEEYAREFERGARRPRRRRGGDIEAELALPISVALEGGMRSFTRPGSASCPACSGQGSRGHHACAACAGLGSVRRERHVDLRIPTDVRDAMTLRLAGLGEPGSGGAEPGDLLLNVRLQADGRFRIVDGELEARLVLTPWDAHAGTRADVRTARGTASVAIPPDTRSGRRLRLRGQGFADGHGAHGDAWVRIELDLPASLSEREKRLLDELASRAGIS